MNEQNNINWKQKLTSRKLWAAIAGIVVGLAAVFGLDDSTISQVAGLVTAAASVVAYITGEAKVDASRNSEMTFNFPEIPKETNGDSGGDSTADL